MPTPHIDAETGDIAPLVLLPGDPRRADHIAAQVLSDARVVSEVRGIRTWTGHHEGTPMSVTASGMGVPSVSIYATELFGHYGVRRICRVGTCGGLGEKVAVRDVVIAQGAHTNSPCATEPVPGASLSLCASFDMLSAAVERARRAEVSHHVGTVHTSDFFYSQRPDILAGVTRMGALAVEMETAGLYACAAAAGAEALTVLTVSDHMDHHDEDMTAQERETSFAQALDIAVAALLG